MTRIIGRRRQTQKGAVILTVALMMFFLLGFMAFALDFGRAFVVKSELQTSMDSCALSAAQELDGGANAVARAISAGITAGNLNKVNFQSAGNLVTADDIQFYDKDLAVTTSDTAAKYVECMRTQTGVQMLLMGALDFFSQGSGNFPGARDVAARAVASRSSAQSTCPIPVALRPKTGHESDKPHYGFQPGDWITMLTTPGGFGPGQAGWANLDGSNNASETVKEMNGKCGVKTGDPLGTPGQQANVTDVWNYRFGIYRQPGDPSHAGVPGTSNDPNQRPDFTGYAYTSTNWKDLTTGISRNAWSGDKAVYGRHVTADNFKAKRQSYASCADTGNNVRGGANSCESITGLTLSGFLKLAAPGAGVMGGHFQYGSSRRIVLVPVLNPSNNTIQDFACMFMLQPLSNPAAPSVQLEYIGNAGEVGSPCTTSGLPGGAAGPLVPVLIR